MKQKVLSLIYIFICCSGILASSFSSLAFAAEDVFQGHAEKSENAKDKSELFTGSIDKLDKKDVLILTVSKVLDGSISKENEEFFAEVTDDVDGANGVIIPSGTVAHGKIRQVSGAKRLGRDGALDLVFDYLITPDGREIPIKGKMSTRLHPALAASKIMATDVGYTALVSAAGGLFALNYFGMNSAIASQGSTIAGGAALGGAVGLGVALYRKGHDVLISPGDEIRIKINSSVPLPVYKKNIFPQRELGLDGLAVEIKDVIYQKDIYGDVGLIVLSLRISNKTNKTFSIFDLALVNDYKTEFYPSVFGGAEAMFSELKPGDKFDGTITFSVDNVKNKFWLTFYDRKNKKVVAEISLNNAYRQISDKRKKQNAKFFNRKTNFYKEESPFDD